MLPWITLMRGQVAQYRLRADLSAELTFATVELLLGMFLHFPMLTRRADVVLARERFLVGGCGSVLVSFCHHVHYDAYIEPPQQVRSKTPYLCSSSPPPSTLSLGTCTDVQIPGEFH